MLLDQERLVSDKFSPKVMYQRLGKEFQSVTLIAVVEDEEKVGPYFVNVRSHEKSALEDQMLAPDDPVRRHKHQDCVLSARVRPERLRYIECFAEVGPPFGHRL